MIRRGLVLVLSAILSLVSCGKEENMPLNGPLSDMTREYSVGMKDVESFLNNLNSTATKSSFRAIESIIPIVDKDQDTLLYVVNYTDSWTILSGDMRTPPEIACGMAENSALDLSNPAFLSWLNMVAIDLKNVKSSTNEELTFSSDEIASNVSKWIGIGDRWIDPDTPLDPDPPEPPFPQWVLYDTETYDEFFQLVPHLVNAHWGQGSPYNDYCPPKSGGGHYLVGCGGVAAGAMLHHLYEENGYPTLFDGIPMDSLVLDYPLIDSLAYTPRYLRAINDAMDMLPEVNYLSGGTFVLPNKVVDMFEDAGYSCTYASFDSQVVSSSLWNNDPIIALAFDEWILNIPNVTEGHYFIIDGYEKRRSVTANHYVLYNNGQIVPNSEYTEYIYGQPYISRVMMNWGWVSQWEANPENNGLYFLTGSWTTTNGTFDTSRHMIYGFE